MFQNKLISQSSLITSDHRCSFYFLCEDNSSSSSWRFVLFDQYAPVTRSKVESGAYNITFDVIKNNTTYKKFTAYSVKAVWSRYHRPLFLGTVSIDNEFLDPNNPSSSTITYELDLTVKDIGRKLITTDRKSTLDPFGTLKPLRHSGSLTEFEATMQGSVSAPSVGTWHWHTVWYPIDDDNHILDEYNGITFVEGYSKRTGDTFEAGTLSQPLNNIDGINVALSDSQYTGELEICFPAVCFPEEIDFSLTPFSS